ncbi:unnamed protein product [Rotaria sp. Silwood2]|nr:unnamed protein product [Rotaria sp. Silwood2]CAF2995249.1 unnamed protein product [Rotaria sp. Silwood2]CAF3158193.1 unnamed protein product [Rotaria sp. Silwood2]CAF4046892.1 unnamed protein product [Rotaria sp. Silwood2]CAF4120430.1 unnamed protein product [Rotaria sp. Silwood2]
MNRNKWTLSEYLTYILLTLVFLSSWTDINGIFAELPQIVLTQPEHWKLGAYLALVTNLGNIAPASIVLIQCLYKKYKFNPIPINYIIIIIGMFSCFLLVFFWQYTTIIKNQKHSTALLILAFFLSLLDCTSSVSFADYIQRFRKEFTSALFLGESLTSIIPSILAIAQGNGQLYCIPSINGTNTPKAVYKTARFSVSIYFLCLFFLLTISLISFVLLQWTQVARTTYQNLPKIYSKSIEDDMETTNTFVEQKPIASESFHLNKTSCIILLLGCAYTSSILFGILLSVSPYVLMPYGHRIFYLGTILSPWMLTLIWIFGIIKPLISKLYIFIFILCGTVTFFFDMFVAFKSPCPPFVNTQKGDILILIVWLSTYVLLGYPRLIIANYVRSYSSNGMFWYGVNVQLGALIGSIIIYHLIETFSLLNGKMPCEQITC